MDIVEETKTCKHTKGWVSIGKSDMGEFFNCRECQTTKLAVEETSEYMQRVKAHAKIKLKLLKETDDK